MKQRLDAELVARGFFPTKAKALAAVLAGKVLVNGQKAEKAGHNTKPGDLIELLPDACPYVSRGGLKLKAALIRFGINAAGKPCLDVGASTGGFTDCFLKEGATMVHTVDVGKGQLDASLAKDARVKFYPDTNARYMRADMFSPRPLLAAVDVSFISLKLVLLPVLASMAPGGELVALIKPQFELTPKQVPHGIVRQEEFRLAAVSGLREFLAGSCAGAEDNGVFESPVKGAKGNIEYLWHVKAPRV